MTTLFVVCAALGGTVLVLQFLLTLIGLSGDSLGVEVPHDVGHDLGGLDHDVSGDFHGDGAGDAHGGDHPADDHAATAAHHGTVWLFRAISFRTVVAALAFFGLAGLAAEAKTDDSTTILAVAVAAGLAAMYGVYAMLSGMKSLKAEGTVRISRAVGRQATVYLRIPPKNSGAGKIQVNLQNRTVECAAFTPGEAIPTGATVVVTEVIGSDTVRVQPVLEPERNSHV
jgi:hypothetical protein